MLSPLGTSTPRGIGKATAAPAALDPAAPAAITHHERPETPRIDLGARRAMAS